MNKFQKVFVIGICSLSSICCFIFSILLLIPDIHMPYIEQDVRIKVGVVLLVLSVTGIIAFVTFILSIPFVFLLTIIDEHT